VTAVAVGSAAAAGRNRQSWREKAVVFLSVAACERVVEEIAREYGSGGGRRRMWTSSESDGKGALLSVSPAAAAGGVAAVIAAAAAAVAVVAGSWMSALERDTRSQSWWSMRCSLGSSSLGMTIGGSSRGRMMPLSAMIETVQRFSIDRSARRRRGRDLVRVVPVRPDLARSRL